MEGYFGKDDEFHLTDEEITSFFDSQSRQAEEIQYPETLYAQKISDEVANQKLSRTVSRLVEHIFERDGLPGNDEAIAMTCRMVITHGAIDAIRQELTGVPDSSPIFQYLNDSQAANDEAAQAISTFFPDNADTIKEAVQKLRSCAGAILHAAHLHIGEDNSSL